MHIVNILRNEKTAISGSVAAFVAFVILLRLSGISVATAVNMQNSLLMAFLASSPLSVAFPFILLIVALIFLALSFAFLSSYGCKPADARGADVGDEKKTGYYAGAVNAVIFIAAFQSLASVVIAIAFVLASGYIIPLAYAYARELKKWVRFRSGSNSVSKALMIFNIFVAAAILIVVYMNVGYYQDSFRNELKDSMHAAIPVPAGVNAAVVEKEISKQIDAMLATPFFVSYFRWLPLITAFGTWVLLEFLRNILLSNAGGAFNFILLRLYDE